MFCVLSFFSVKAQSATEKIKLLGQAKDTIICFNCGFGKSNAVEKIRTLIQSKKYTEIKQLMLSNNAAENYLAAVTCKKLFTQKKLSLSYNEEKLIQKIFNSSTKRCLAVPRNHVAIRLMVCDLLCDVCHWLDGLFRVNPHGVLRWSSNFDWIDVVVFYFWST